MTELTTTMSAERSEYIKRLWSTDLFLTFDGDLLHLPGATFSWKTGLEAKDAVRPEDKVNELNTSQDTRVRHSLARIAEAWAKENREKSTKVLERASL